MTPTARRSTRDVLATAPDLDAERERAKRGGPWCDTCQRPSVGNHGLQHVTDEHPFGVPHEWDESGHWVTHLQWFDTPSSRTEAEIAEAEEASLAARVSAVAPDVVAAAFGVPDPDEPIDGEGGWMPATSQLLRSLAEHGLKVVRA